MQKEARKPVPCIVKSSSVIRKSLKDRLSEDAIIYYCIPGDPLNADFDIRFHLVERDMTRSFHHALHSRNSCPVNKLAENN